jgi:hypothetical protein
MAQLLPSMAPAFAALGYEGEKGLAKLAAMLQTIRQRTGSAGEAATAAQNIFQKMESDETVKKFAKFGINLRAAMADARRDGKDLVDVFLDLSQKALKGDLSKIPQLFTDAQFQVGMRALLQGRQDMEGFQTALADVDGTTLRDLGQILSDNEAKLDRMASSWEKFKTSIGKAAVSAGVPDALDYVASGAERAAAVNAGLEKNGVHGFVARSIWGITHGEADKDAMAFAGGFRTDEQNRAYAAYGAYSQSRAAAAAANTIPIPTPRPDPTRMPARPTVAAPRGPLRTGMMPGPSFRETEVASMDALRRDGNSIANEIDAALSKGAETLAPALIDASRPAGQSLGDTAASAISMQADGIGTRIGTAIGTALQPYISSAIADLSRPIGSLKGGSSGRLATGNPGRSMPNAGRLPGPV